MTPHRLLLSFVLFLLPASNAALADDANWVGPMKKVRERYTGTPGTFAAFGDSITVSMAFWAPLRGELKKLPDDMAAAHAVVKKYMKPECWTKWRGPGYGSNGSMTIRWAYENVDKWLKDHNPEVAVIMFGTNDLGALGVKEYEQKTAEVVDRCLKSGTVVILTTPPPRSGHFEKSKEFAEAVRRIAAAKKVPVIDYHGEILKRRPDDWDGSLAKFKDVKGSEYDVPTLIARDGVHPSNPSAFKDFSNESLRCNGYALRNYLTLLAYADVVRKVLSEPQTSARKPPGPWDDPKDTSVWPNQTSRANSDPWLAANHERIRLMKPRVLLINFSNEHARGHLDILTKRLIAALAEASRYHGYLGPKAPPFLKYEVFKFIDLRDQDRTKGDARLVPIKNPQAKRGFNMKYSAYFSEDFAKHFGVPDPRQPQRYLRLDELVDRGHVHEVWFFLSGAPETPHIGAYEVVEEMPRYDSKFQKMGNQFVQAGNGGDRQQPWTGRSVRIGCINASRGVGCFLESLSHGMEEMAKSGAVPYYSRYFRDYAGLNLTAQFQVPFDSLYAVSYGGRQIRYPDEKTMVITHAGKEYRIDNYVAAGGNAHFPPNGRSHYDLENAGAVLSTIEDWRMGGGANGKDQARPFTNAAFRHYRDLAPDCMGPWLIYWRQNMPGLDNKQKDDAGQPMKNWWPFLFY